MEEETAMHEGLVNGHGHPCTSGKCHNDNSYAATPNNNNQLDKDGGGTWLHATTLLMAMVALAP
jgi:hypothetical protein